jgi:DNA-binding transcriptional ArsR family regulator
MKLKLQLVQDGEIIFEIPLSPMDWSQEHLENEFNAIEEDFQRFSKIFDALAHETRLRMMKLVMEEEDRTLSFSDFMRGLDLNPKLVWENARKLKEGGLLEKVGRGRYRCSEFGESGFIMMSFALKRIRKVLEELKEL